MRYLGIFVFGSLAVYSFASERMPDIEALPRGVPYNRAALYKRSFEFMCLDGSKSILYSQVNDDYCDCPDGSDEPGTSACPNGKFHCANKGHTAADIPSSRVNDRICDCCDGSDEYSGAVECPNICDELGRSAREEKKRQAELSRKGFAARKQLALDGQKLRDEKIKAVAPLKEERDKLLPTKEDLLQKKNTAVEKESALKNKHNEAWEASKEAKRKEKSNSMFREIDVNGDQKITLDELKKLDYVDSNRDGTVSDEEAKIHMIVDEADAEYFLNNMYEGLKSAKKLGEYHKNDQQEEHDDLVADEDREETTTGPTTDATPDGEMNASHMDEDNDYASPPYDEETNKAIEEAEAARKQYDELDVKLSTLDSQIREAESFVEQDFGSDHAWATLKGQCFELSEKQYTYKFCPFDRTVQKEKSSFETGLGNWKEWSGEPQNKYSKQTYDGGQQCWNGPQRSTEVVIECGEKSELVEATEPAKCEYRFVFRTPAGCTDPDHEEPTHMEL
ncbi:Glucosidase 2 subunit beta [Trichostrongylus colubriformis]|uniref:Glucosidase 2 subunit beta n=1 Tax=Trichostrongylus colubriformis TaxID=6319 RepID=A0AAN8IET8_TRICO